MREIGLHRSKYEQLKREAAEGKKPPIFDRVIDESAQIAESADVTSNVKTLRQKYGYGNNYANYASLTEEFIWRCQ